MGRSPFSFFLQIDGTYDGKGDMRWKMDSCKWERGGSLCMTKGVASGESWEIGTDGRCSACKWEKLLQVQVGRVVCASGGTAWCKRRMGMSRLWHGEEENGQWVVLCRRQELASGQASCENA